MPKFDGTGPRGQGPMTGRARGYCLLNIPDDAAEAKTGFVGLQGKPIGQDPMPADFVLLRNQLWGMQTTLADMKLHLTELESKRADVRSHG